MRRSPSPGPSSRSSHLAPVVPPAHLGRRPVLPPAGGARHVRRPSDKQLSRVARCAPLPEAGPACPGAQAGGRQQRRAGCGRRHPGGCLGHHTFASGLPRALRLLVSGQRQASGRRPAAPRAASGAGPMRCAPTTREDLWSASRPAPALTAPPRCWLCSPRPSQLPPPPPAAHPRISTRCDATRALAPPQRAGGGLPLRCRGVGGRRLLLTHPRRLTSPDGEGGQHPPRQAAQRCTHAPVCCGL